MSNPNPDKRRPSRTGRQLGVALTAEERQKIDDYAASLDLRPSVFVRALVLDVVDGQRALPRSVKLFARARASFSPESLALRSELHRVGNNVNQLLRGLWDVDGNGRPLTDQDRATLRECRAILDRIERSLNVGDRVR